MAKKKISKKRLDFFPHQNEIYRGVVRFFIDGRWLGLYYHKNRTPSAPFSLHWDNELNPIQHAMTDLEVFHVLASIINKNKD